MSKLNDAVNGVLHRLGDKKQLIWSVAEIELYVRDGYDEFCRRTQAVWDRVVIENRPPAGNWQTDLEYALALEKPGFGLTDEPFHFSGNERNLGTEGRVGGSYSGPAGLTSPSDSQYSDQVDSVPTQSPGGRLPASVVEVKRVMWDQRTIMGLTSMQAHQLDPQYETRGGDPQFYTLDKDGLNYLRLIPQPAGDASYDDVDGSWGTMTQTDDTDVTVVTTEPNGYATGGYGILRWRSDMFPSGGTDGTPTRVHPDEDNTVVEVTRLGRDLSGYDFELPEAYMRYVIYWAMGRALRRDGSGQDLELADHFNDRFEMGVYRMREKRERMAQEMVGKFGPSSGTEEMGLGEPQLPYPYSIPRY